MQKYNILVLTDHLTHSPENSVYALCGSLKRHAAVESVHLASRSNAANRRFFFEMATTELEVWELGEEVSYEIGRTALVERTIRVDVRFYDVVWLRLPRPVSEGFFTFLTAQIDEQRIINRPSGIVEAGNKAFLTKFPELCPPLKHCQTVEEIWNFHERFPVVLKPVENYGGRGIVKLSRGYIYEGDKEIAFGAYKPVMEEQLARGGYLAMKFMKNVAAGDKRIIVVNGVIVGAVLRMPPKGSWICNAAQGGRAALSAPDDRERWMVERLNEVLLSRGIIMYGADTLLGDDGHRILSEVNTLSIGGIKPMADLTGLPLVERAADLLMDYILGNVGRRSEVMV